MKSRYWKIKETGYKYQQVMIWMMVSDMEITSRFEINSKKFEATKSKLEALLIQKKDLQSQLNDPSLHEPIFTSSSYWSCYIY